MSRFAAVLTFVFVLLVGSLASAATALPGKGPYTFNGIVSSATASCPYPAGSKLAGYTFTTGFQVFPSSSGQFGQSQGIELVISPGGKAVKQGLIPRLTDQYLCAQSRNPMDMILQGLSSIFLHASQQ
jgi:hypothetical protein